MLKLGISLARSDNETLTPPSGGKSDLQEAILSQFEFISVCSVHSLRGGLYLYDISSQGIFSLMMRLEQFKPLVCLIVYRTREHMSGMNEHLIPQRSPQRIAHASLFPRLTRRLQCRETRRSTRAGRVRVCPVPSRCSLLPWSPIVSADARLFLLADTDDL